MQCPQCRHENAPRAKFCEECATPLARRCSQCGADLSPTAKFCPECAHPTGVQPAQAVSRFSSAESYTPKHLAEKILTSKAALEGERKQVTVLFADLKGSMELLADRDPEEARKLLDPVIERMMEAVHRYEGTVNQVMGDGIMALFGAPLAHEDHAVRACYAALRMQESLKRYADDTRRTHGVEVQIRVGLNSGEVVVRSVGSDLRMDYTAVGQTTHLAARMEQLAPPGTVRLTGETVRLAEGYIEVRSLGPIPVKGLPDPIELFELTGAGTARTRLQAAALRGLTRFVGRDAEVEHLRRVLGQAGAGRGQVVAIVGEAGVGKSRLTYEFTHSHRVQDWLILEASSVSYGKATSYLPVIDLLKGYFKIGDRDDHREMRAKVLGRVLGLDRALEPLLPPLLALLDVPVEDPAWQNLDPPQRRQRTLDAGQAPAAAREPGATAAGGLRGPALDRRRDPGPARQPRGEPGVRPPPAPGELPPRVRAPLGEQDGVLPAPARHPARRERGGAAGGAPRAGPRAGAADADAGEAGQPVLPGGDGADAGGDGGAGGGARGVPADAAGGGAAGAGDGADDPGGADRPAAAGGEAAPAGGLGDRQATCPTRSWRRSRSSRRRPCGGGSRISRRRSSSTRRSSSRTWSTPSSTR